MFNQSPFTKDDMYRNIAATVKKLGATSNAKEVVAKCVHFWSYRKIEFSINFLKSRAKLHMKYATLNMQKLHIDTAISILVH